MTSIISFLNFVCVSAEQNKKFYTKIGDAQKIWKSGVRIGRKTLGKCDIITIGNCLIGFDKNNVNIWNLFDYCNFRNCVAIAP